MTLVVATLLSGVLADGPVWEKYIGDAPLNYIFALLPLAVVLLIGLFAGIALPIKWYCDYRAAGGRVFK